MIWTAETPIAFYRLVTMPFNVSGERDPQTFEFQKHFLKLLILSHRFLMTIPELCYTGPVYRGINLSNYNIERLHDQLHNYESRFASGVVKDYTAPVSFAFNSDKVRRQAKPNRTFDQSTVFASPSYALFNLLFDRSMPITLIIVFPFAGQNHKRSAFHHSRREGSPADQGY